MNTCKILPNCQIGCLLRIRLCKDIAKQDVKAPPGILQILNISEIRQMFNARFQLVQKCFLMLNWCFFPHKYLSLVCLSLREVSKSYMRTYPEMCSYTLNFYSQVIITNIFHIIRKVYFSYTLGRFWRQKDFVFCQLFV